MHQICNHPEDSPSLASIVIFPNTREVALSSLGFMKVFSLLTKLTKPCDISFLPGYHSTLLSPRKRILLGLGTGIAVKEFDMVCFSIAYENDFANVPRLLAMSRIAPLACERRDRFPLVVFGGFAMFSNPLPVADFADAVVVGEAEASLPSLVEVVRKAKRFGWSKEETLDNLAQINGVFVPSIKDSTVTRVWADVDEILDDVSLMPDSHFASSFLLEMGRGCRRGCLFCSAGRLYHPVRERSFDVLVEQTRGHDRIGLLGTAVGDHRDLVSLLREIVSTGKQVSISSLRPDNITPEIASLLARGGLKSLAIAPECGSDELRYRVGKPIQRATISDSVRMLSQAGLSSIKLYFMIGLPTEKDDDVRAIVGLVEEIAKVRGSARLIVGISPFVPKPHTPLQWAQVAPKQYLKKALGILKDLTKIKGCTLRPVSIDEALTQSVICRAERSFSSVLLECALNNLSIRTSIRRKGFQKLLQSIDVSVPLPWDFLDNRTSKQDLIKQYQRFLGSK